MKKRLLVAFTALSLGLVFLACPEEKGTFEKAGKKLDKATEKAKEEVHDALEKAADELEK